MIWTTRPRSEGAGALHYFAEGSGPSLVLIHGVGLRAEAWCGVLPFLVNRYRVICVDLPGHGQSPFNASGDLDEFRARFQPFIAALEGPVAVAGHSLGALVAIDLAAHSPGKVSSVAGLNTVYRRSAQATAAVKQRALCLEREGAADPSATLARWFGENPKRSEKEAAIACRDWLITCDPKGYAAAYNIFAHQDGPSDATLAKLACATLFMTGKADPNSTPDMSHALAARTGGACHILDGAAHMMPMTHAQQVATQLAAHFGSATSPEPFAEP